MAAVAAPPRDRSRSPHRLEDLEFANGLSAKEIFEDPENRFSYAYDDLIVAPGAINFGVTEVVLESRFTRKLSLKLPIVSSPMDTVTESRMAISMALEGGLGVIHTSMSLEDQVKEVQRVKKFKAGFILDPVCITADMALTELDALREKCGFTGFPVTADGKMGSELVGMVTKRDTDFMKRDGSHKTVADIMTPLERMVTTEEGVDLRRANAVLNDSKKGKLPVISKEKKLVALVARTDLKKNAEYPNATKDKNKSLCVAAAVGIRCPDRRERVEALVAAGVDAIVMDNRNGDNGEQRELVRWAKERFPELQVVGGNVATVRQAKALIEAGVDGVRVGMGIASISAAQQMRAVGRGQASAVYHVAKYCQQFDVPVIADGGVTSPGHVLKALTLGASVAMCGSLLAGTEESPGQYFYSDAGVRLKRYRGMFSTGVSGAVQDRGSLHSLAAYLAQGVRHGLQDMGCPSIDDLRRAVGEGRLRFELRSAASQREGGVHGLHSYERKLFSKS